VTTRREPDRYRYDPADPTPNLGGPVGYTGRARVDNRILEARPDVLTYTSAPLAADLSVMGEVSVDLFVRSSLDPGSGEPLGTATTLIAADQAVYHDPDHPSAIVLPVKDR
jgi:predicted acyl esterase